jgi:hypothetical protein
MNKEISDMVPEVDKKLSNGNSSAPEQQSDPINPLEKAWNYPLMDAIVNRRSRRFSLGAEMNGGGLAYKSQEAPVSLSTLEEALLITAGTGITGYALGELPYTAGDKHEAGGGNVMAALTGRTVASADAVHGTALFVINDEGTYLLRRPQDFPQIDIGDLGEMTSNQQVAELYKRLRIQISDKRTTIPREVPHMFPFNKWSSNLPGSTYFVPASDMTGLYINLLLSAFDEQMGLFILDERNGYAPAGIGKFGKSRGGKLHDDPKPVDHRVGTVQLIELINAEFMVAEQAFIGHNMMLAEQAMGLGGWSHFATARDASWFEAFNFRMGVQPLSRTIGSGLFGVLLRKVLGRADGLVSAIDNFDISWRTMVLNLFNQNIKTPIPLGFEHNGEVLLKPYCPPYYKNMEEAVLAFIDTKFARIKDGAAASNWKDPQAIGAAIPKFSDECIAATIAYCDYIYNRYGRFPAYNGAFRMTLAHQAHHLDLAFYDKFYKPGAYTETQAKHMDLWHEAG